RAAGGGRAARGGVFLGRADGGSGAGACGPAGVGGGHGGGGDRGQARGGAGQSGREIESDELGVVMPKWPWIERKFTFDFPVGKHPDIVERFRGLPARVEERVRGLTAAQLTWNDGGWSIQ